MSNYNNEGYDILIGTEDKWTVLVDDENLEEIDHICSSCGQDQDEENEE